MIPILSIILLIKITYSQIAFINMASPQMVSPAGPGYLFSFNSVSTDNFGAFMTDSATTAVLHLVLNISCTTNNFTYNVATQDVTTKTQLSSVQYGIKTRTTQNNGAGGQRIFVMYSNYSVFLYNATTIIKILGVSASSSKVMQAFMVTNSTTITMSLVLFWSSGYSLYLRNVSANVFNTSTNISSTSSYISFVKNNGYAFLMFNTGIYIYAMNSTLTLVNFIGFLISAGSGSGVTANNTKFSITSDSNYLAYSLNNTIYIVNISDITNIVQTNTINLMTQVDNIRIRAPFLFYSSNNTYTQYDLDISTPISNVSNTSIGIRFDILSTCIIFTYQDFPTRFNTFAQLLINNSYFVVNSSTCYQGYVLSLGPPAMCTKNLSYVYTTNTNILNNTLPANISNTTNSTPVVNNNSISNNTPISNISTNTSTMNTSITNSSTTTTIPSLKPNFLSSQVFINIGKSLTFSTIRILPNFYRAFTFFLDDLWYYRFHRVKYPESARIFIQKIDIINLFRLNPWFFNQFNIFNNINNIIIEANKAQTYNSYISAHQNNPDSIYFLNSSSSIYINNFFMNIFFYFCVKVLQLLLYLLKNKFKTFKKPYFQVRDSSCKWSLASMLIQSNLTMLALLTGFQLLVISSLQFLDVLNMMATVLTLFGVIIYSLIFYPLIYRYYKKMSASVFLTHSKYQQESFYFQPFYFLNRNLVRGMIHSLFIFSYRRQIICLVLSDLFFISLNIYFSKQFLSKFLFFCFIIYQLLFLGLDIFFSLHQFIPQIFNIDDGANFSIKISQMYDSIVFGIILGIVMMYITSILYTLLLTIYIQIRKIVKHFSNIQEKTNSIVQTQPNLQQIKNNRLNKSLKGKTVIGRCKIKVTFTKKLIKSEQNTNIINQTIIPVQTINQTQKKVKKTKINKSWLIVT